MIVLPFLAGAGYEPAILPMAVYFTGNYFYRTFKYYWYSNIDTSGERKSNCHLYDS